MSPLGKVCRDFSLVYLATLVLMVLVARLLTELDLGVSGVVALVPHAAAALFAGSRHAEREGRMPAPDVAWRAAIWTAVCAAAIALAALAIATLVIGAPARQELDQALASPGLAVLTLLILALVFIALTRLLFPLGARSRFGQGRP